MKQHRFQTGTLDAQELNGRLLASCQRLRNSELATDGDAWKLWAASIKQTVDFGREADTIYIKTLANLAGVGRRNAGVLLKRLDELGVIVWIPAPLGSRALSELRLPPTSAPGALVEDGRVLHTHPTKSGLSSYLDQDSVVSAKGTSDEEEASSQEVSELASPIVTSISVEEQQRAMDDWVSFEADLSLPFETVREQIAQRWPGVPIPEWLVPID